MYGKNSDSENLFERIHQWKFLYSLGVIAYSYFIVELVTTSRAIFHLITYRNHSVQETLLSQGIFAEKQPQFTVVLSLHMLPTCAAFGFNIECDIGSITILSYHSLFSEIDSYCSYEFSVEFAFCVLEKKGRLPDTYKQSICIEIIQYSIIILYYII